MRIISSGTADFEKIRMDDAIYVDKTEYCWSLICNVSKSQYFLSRPRRFGKSLTISTLKAIFQGRKDLFEGLDISKHNYNWDVYPVIHLSLGDYSEIKASPESVAKYLIGKVKLFAQKNTVELNLVNDTPAAYFEALILAMSAKKNVVVLIDEYDKIITENIGHKDIGKIRDAIAGFYSVLKENEASIRFLFMTGVSKFSQVSIFSKLNNLVDISRTPEFATMLGYTQEEFEANFADYLQQAAEKNGVDLPAIKGKIKRWYDGFQFDENSETVYNPVSVGSFFGGGYKFLNYWFATGTPTFLLKVLEMQNANLENVVCEPVSTIAFESFNVESIDPKILFLQTGYLTLDHTEADEDETMYYLRFPNYEVKSAFLTHFLNSYQENMNVTPSCSRARKATAQGDVPAMIEAVNCFLEQIPYDIKIKNEKYYQSMFYAFFTLSNIKADVENHTSHGRIDAVLISKKHCFVCEFKVDKSAEIAMDQIKAKDYCRKYLSEGYEVTAVGANFDSKAGVISDVQYETVS